jgi:hypothetical protein
MEQCGACYGSGECHNEYHEFLETFLDVPTGFSGECPACGQPHSMPGKCSVCGGRGEIDD